MLQLCNYHKNVTMRHYGITCTLVLFVTFFALSTLVLDGKMKNRRLFLKLFLPAWTGVIVFGFYYYITLPKVRVSLIGHDKPCGTSTDRILGCDKELARSTPIESFRYNKLASTEDSFQQQKLQQYHDKHTDHMNLFNFGDILPTKLHGNQLHKLQQYSEKDSRYTNRAESSQLRSTEFDVYQPLEKDDRYTKRTMSFSHSEMPPAELDNQRQQKLQEYSEAKAHYRNASFALSLHFMDQITCAARRVRSLQCWAAQLNRNIQVVEPTINGSYLGPPLKKPIDGIVEFRHIFDIEWWNFQGTDKGKYLPLVRSDDFFLYAPRSTILISFLYKDDPRCFENSPPNSTCKLDAVRQFWLESLKELSFAVIKEVCIDFRDVKVLNRNEFNDLIFGNIPASKPVTIIFNDWRGPLSVPHKNEFNALIRYRDRECSPMEQESFVRKLTAVSLKPTPEIFASATAYATKYLNTSSKYVAIMVRWELVLLEHIYRYHAFKGPQNSGKTCKEKISSAVEEMYTQRGLSARFLATDAGRYGSRVLQPNALFHGKSYWKPAKELTEELLEDLNNKSMTIEQYDEHFTEFSEANSVSSYYVPQLQKAIAARAECLLLVGWGTFHDNVRTLYTELHQGQMCYKNIQSC